MANRRYAFHPHTTQHSGLLTNLPIDWPRNPRLKQIGMYNRLQWEEGIEGWSMFLLTNILHWKKEEVMVYLAQMRTALRNRSIHAYHEMSVPDILHNTQPFLLTGYRSVVYGRKPPALVDKAED